MFAYSDRVTHGCASVRGALLLVTIACVSLAVASRAGASSVFGSNLIVNGNAESGSGSTDGGSVPSIPGWNTHGTLFTVVEYGSYEFPALTDPGPKERGKNFFAGGEAASSKGTQSIDVSSGALAIDTGKTKLHLSGWLGGYTDQGDAAVLTIDFYNDSNTKLGSAVIGPVTAADRKDVTGLFYKETSSLLPEGTRTIKLSLVLTRVDGAYDDGYADDLALVLTAPPLTATKTSLTAVKTEITAGTAESLTALVTPSSGSTTPSGTVTFKSASTVLGTVTLNGAGQATLTTSSLKAGSDSLTATYNASLIFSASTSSATTVTVTEPSTLNLTPASISFPETAVGATSTTQQATLRNIGKVSAAISSVTLTGGQSDDFTLNSACGTSLAAGSSCTISVAFKPISAGAKSAKLSVVDDASGSPQTMALSGTGVESAGKAAIKLSTTSLKFSSQKSGTSSATQSVTVSNSGTGTLTLTSIRLAGNQSDDFVLKTTCANSLAAGANCSLSITFKPVSAGSKVASISIADNAPGSPQSVALSGTGS